jgi:hypothetical protein
VRRTHTAKQAVKATASIADARTAWIRVSITDKLSFCSMVQTLDPCARVRRKDAEYYIELIGYLISVIGEARLTDLAEHLGVIQGTTPKVVKRLQREGLVESLPYLSIFLTAHGVEVAAMSHVRHDIVRTRCRGGCPAAKTVIHATDARSE